MEHVYVTLPSNSSYQYYGIQPMSNYKTKLAKDLHLDVAEWEVGLAEFIYPISWYNVMNATFSVRKLIDGEWTFVDGEVPNNRYESVQQLIDTLTEAIDTILEKQKGCIILNALPTRHVKAFLSDGYALKLSQSLSESLGFGDRHRCELRNAKDRTANVEKCDTVLGFDGESILSPFVADVNRGLRSLFIHCDIVQSQLVGDLQVPLLRTVAVRGQTEDVVAESFSNIHYMRIERSTFQEIEVHITDDVGRRVPFQHGRVLVKLHFKRK